ncbi:MAG: sulfatase-like hydrolase/transferase [Verrucomicrobia bacterium]|nr:sulfatase-like hydrolase/transferase [Verrucomicrobiota bacterium]
MKSPDQQSISGKTATRPNILLVMTDSLAPQFTGPYGDPVGHTPAQDDLAAHGVVFENAYCNSPLCVPSRASIVTGRMPSDLGCLDNGNPFSSEIPTMGHVLRSVGYETTIVGKMHFLGHDQEHGFDRVALEQDYTSGYSPNHFRLAYQWDGPVAGNPMGDDWMGPSYVNGEAWVDYRHHFDLDEGIHKAALAFLDGKDATSDPFFCCVSYHHPHNPFWAPASRHAELRDRHIPLPSVADPSDLLHGPMDQWLQAFHYVPEVADQLMEPDNLRWLYETYYAMVLDVDRRLQALRDRLVGRGLAPNTAVIFCSDHGDMLAQRGMIQKRTFYEHASRVPLICSFPGHWAERYRCETPVSLLDLLPTLADLTQASVPDGLSGRSLLTCLTDGREPATVPVFCEYHGEGVHAPCFMVRDGDHKYIYVHGHEERLYNLRTDPDEKQNLAGNAQVADVLTRLRSLVLERFDPDAIAISARRSQHDRRYVWNSEQGRPRR